MTQLKFTPEEENKHFVFIILLRGGGSFEIDKFFFFFPSEEEKKNVFSFLLKMKNVFSFCYPWGESLKKVDTFSSSSFSQEETETIFSFLLHSVCPVINYLSEPAHNVKYYCGTREPMIVIIILNIQRNLGSYITQSVINMVCLSNMQVMRKNAN